MMQLALAEAEAAALEGEVPVGAVIALGGQVIARNHNRRESWRDPTAHAEIIVLKAASLALNRWRLHDTTLYVTLEPCPMCAGALVNARVERLVYGTTDAKAGAVDSLFCLPNDPRLNHRVSVTSGVLAHEAQLQLQSFFRARRPGPR
ncbi:MAG: nucleoside deaminase [Deltaproteobacteria bacterium]|nr:nucleoside deaminase [Deltaproteobacteria bacterium]